MGLDDADREILGEIARRAVAAAAAGRPYQPPPPERPALLEQRGCFVTIRTGGDLRGCIGCFASARPLYATVAEYARHAVLDDPRFAHNRLGASEAAGAEVEISVLSPLRECRDPEGITPGVHGVYVSNGLRSGCFLPQVATETGWTVEELWGHCCHDKAGLDWDAWRRPGVTLMIFTVEAGFKAL